MKLITFLRSCVFNLCFFSWSLLSSIIFAPFFIISSRASQISGPLWAGGTLWLAKIICGVTSEVRGRENISVEPVIYASKHQSAWDTMIYLVLLRQPAYVLKRELLRIPGWGWYLWRMKMVAIDRSGKASSLKQMVKDSKAVMEDGRSIVIFPEGTRTRPEATPDYHPGIIALYSQLKKPVVPVALNSGTFWGKNAFIKYPGKVVIEFLPPIPPGLPKDQFAATMQQSIETASSALRNEALARKINHD